MRLWTLEGKYIPTFLGHFVLQFPSRELPEDRSCRVLILEVLDGQPLSTISLGKLSEDQRTKISNQVTEIVGKVQDKGLEFPVIYLDRFLMLSNGEVRLFGFGCTFDANEHY